MKRLTLFSLSLITCLNAETWKVDSNDEWVETLGNTSKVTIESGMVEPQEEKVSISSKLKTFEGKKKALNLTLTQSPVWLNWEPISNLGPENLQDAPVFLALGPDDYWMFGRYGNDKKKSEASKGEPVTLDGFEIELKTSGYDNQYDAPGGLEEPQEQMKKRGG